MVQIQALVRKNSVIFNGRLKRSLSFGLVYFKAKDAFKHWLESILFGPEYVI